MNTFAEAAALAVLFAVVAEWAKFGWHRLVTRKVRIRVSRLVREGRPDPVRGATVVINDDLIVVLDESGKGEARVKNSGPLRVRVFDSEYPMWIENSTPGRWLFVRVFAESEIDLDIIVKDIQFKEENDERIAL